ncbi:MAG: alpha/beta fold hydrolase [Alphaproteobacteria bacterium]|nr:alpha/beta fold hydrolase [Alphaproteobacteria bacterium]
MACAPQQPADKSTTVAAPPRCRRAARQTGRLRKPPVRCFSLHRVFTIPRIRAMDRGRRQTRDDLCDNLKERTKMQPAAATPETMQPQILTATVEGIDALGGAPCCIAYALWQPQDKTPLGTVVAVHGLTRQKRDFDFVAAHLAREGWRVIAADAPGRGGSDWLKDAALYDLEVYADIFTGFMKGMGLDSAHWIGTSMGGLIAMTMAEKGNAAMLQSLTLVDITPAPNAAGLARIAQYVTETMPVFSSRAQYAELLKLNLPLGDDVPEEVWEHYAQHQLVETQGGLTFHFDPLIARAARPALEKGVDLSSGMAKISCPVALVAGGVSDLCTAAEIDALKAGHPEARVHIRAGAGHVPALEDAATQHFIAHFIDGAQ